MTVGELIEMLQDYDKERRVLIVDSAGWRYTADHVSQFPEEQDVLIMPTNYI